MNEELSLQNSPPPTSQLPAWYKRHDLGPGNIPARKCQRTRMKSGFKPRSQTLSCFLSLSVTLSAFTHETLFHVVLHFLPPIHQSRTPGRQAIKWRKETSVLGSGKSVCCVPGQVHLTPCTYTSLLGKKKKNKENGEGKMGSTSFKKTEPHKCSKFLLFYWLSKKMIWLRYPNNEIHSISFMLFRLLGEGVSRLQR